MSPSWQMCTVRSFISDFWLTDHRGLTTPSRPVTLLTADLYERSLSIPRAWLSASTVSQRIVHPGGGFAQTRWHPHRLR